MLGPRKSKAKKDVTEEDEKCEEDDGLSYIERQNKELEEKLKEDSVGKIKQMGANASKVFEIMKTLQAMKLQKKDSKPGEVIKDKIFIGGVGTAYNKQSL